jgi:hypothetical protein
MHQFPEVEMVPQDLMGVHAVHADGTVRNDMTIETEMDIVEGHDIMRLLRAVVAFKAVSLGPSRLAALLAQKPLDSEMLAVQGPKSSPAPGKGEELASLGGDISLLGAADSFGRIDL